MYVIAFLSRYKIYMYIQRNTIILKYDVQDCMNVEIVYRKQTSKRHIQNITLQLVSKMKIK